MHRDYALNLAASLAGVACLLGCPGPDDDPCEDDALGCQTSGGLEMDSSCTLSDDLEVEVGWGLDEFTTLESPGQVWFGFQGGQHTFLGVRIANAALDQYDQVEVTFQLAGIEEDCVENWDQVILSSELVEECSSYPNERRVVFGEHQDIRTDANGAMEEYGIFLEIPSNSTVIVSARALDPCGRTGSAISFFAGGS